VEPAQLGVAAGTAVSARPVSLARRLLGGAGRAALLAYDLAPVVEAAALVHGLSRSGELLVACLADDEIPATTWEHTPLRVRLEVIKEAPEWSVRITSCAVHLLGVLEWLPDETRAHYLAEAGLHPRMVELASAPNGRLGIVRTERVLLHDCSGVTPFAFAELVDPGTARAGGFPTADQEWAARDLVGRLTATELDELFDAASGGWESALTLSEGAGGCPHTQRQVFFVDIDRTGLTLMEAEAGFTTVTVLTFDQPADSIEELADGLRQLLESAATAQRAS